MAGNTAAMSQLDLFAPRPKTKPDPEAWRRSWPACVLCGVQDRMPKVFAETREFRGSVHVKCLEEKRKR